MKIYHCVCGQMIFFENVQCMNCGRALGFLPDLMTMSSLEPDRQSIFWLSTDREAGNRLYKKCQNFFGDSTCNWMIPPEMERECFCLSCRLDEIIPDLSIIQNRARWALTEGAKRRLIYSLLELRLPLENRRDNPRAGLGFRFLANTINPDGTETPVLTGHENGIITLNIAEADDIYRERARLLMNEPYRTLVGHFRHEIGHYYWGRIVRDTKFIDGFRQLFGDERAGYEQALKSYYATGAPSDWQTRFISVYATAHPWEDWAETWAHYLHISDTLEVASNFGLVSKQLKLDLHPAPGSGAQFAPKPEVFDQVIGAWAQFSVALNSINRSMGLADIYPFVLSRPVVEKLRFISEVIAGSEVGRTGAPVAN